MIYRLRLLLALLTIGTHASQPPKKIQLPLDVTSIIISYVITDDWFTALGEIKDLNRVNKEWHAALNTYRIFKQIVLQISEKADGQDEITIAKGMRNWPAFKNLEFQAWFTKRQEERMLEDELFSAARDNKDDKIKTLVVEKEVNINARNKSGRTALSIAASDYHCLNALKEILKYNPDINLANKAGWTPLKKAANAGNRVAVDLLLSAKADPNIQDEQGYTPLLNAACLAILKALIAAKANVNHQPYCNNRYTALMWAAYNNNQAALELLLAAGARKDLKTEDGLTALDIAKKKQHFTIQFLFILDDKNQSDE